MRTNHQVRGTWPCRHRVRATRRYRCTDTWRYRRAFATTIVCSGVCAGSVAIGIASGCNAGAPLAASAEAGAGAPLDAAPESTRIPYDGLPEPQAGPRTPVHAELVTSRVDTMQMMFAAGEMQTSGEPFASIFAGRNLLGYLR